MNHSYNTEGTPITALRQDVVMAQHLNDNDTQYSVDSIKTSTDFLSFNNI